MNGTSPLAPVRLMKILVANLGSTSLKWRLFDFSNGQERMLHKGGFERVTDYPKAIGDCLAQLKDAGHIQSESDLAAVGFKTIMARGVNGCVRLDERVVKAMEAFNGIAPAHNPPYITGIRLFAQRMPAVPLVGLFETAFYQWVPDGGDALRRAGSVVRAGRAPLGLSRREPQVHRRALGGTARPRRCGRARAPALRGRRRDARCASPTCA